MNTPEIVHTREGKIDILIILIMGVYGVLVLDTTPFMSVAAWIIATLLILRNTVDSVGEYAESHPIRLNILLLAILIGGYLLS